MKEYIERAAIIERLQKVQMDGYGFSQGVQFGVDHAITCIKEAPAADVVEMRHARWIKHEGYDECEACRAKVIYGYNYCPNCGARMDKEDEHEAD